MNWFCNFLGTTIINDDDLNYHLEKVSTNDLVS